MKPLPLLPLLLYVAAAAGNAPPPVDAAASFFESAIAASQRAHDVLCRKCGAAATKTAAVIQKRSSSPLLREERLVEGVAVPALRFENTAGFKFSVLTFNHEGSAVTTKLSSSKKRTSRELKDTFFPGYTWRPVMCPVCGAHLGWIFESESECVGPVPVGEVAPPDEEPKVVSEDDALSAYVGVCHQRTFGFWTYKLCHRKEIRQFHLENRKKTLDWSLGRFDNNKERPMGKLGGRRIHSEFYSGGQRCDETDRPRSTEVQMLCCTVKEAKNGAIAGIEEYSTCKYRVRVCIPELCELPGYREVENGVGNDNTEGSVTTAAGGSESLNEGKGSGTRKGGGRAAASKDCIVKDKFLGLIESRLLVLGSPSSMWLESVVPRTEIQL